MNLFSSIRTVLQRPVPSFFGSRREEDRATADRRVIANLHERVERLFRDLEAAETTIAELAGEKIGTEEALASALRAGAELQEKAAHLEIELEASTSGLQRLTDDLVAADLEKRRLTELLETAQREIEELRSELLRLRGGEQMAFPSEEGEKEPAAAAVRELVADSTSTVGLEIVRLSFRDKNTWHFTQGDEELSAKIVDEGFLARLHAREVAFADGDIVVAKVRAVSYKTSAGIKTDRTIVEVLEVQPPPEQLRLAASPVFVIALAVAGDCTTIAGPYDWMIPVALILGMAGFLMGLVTLFLRAPRADDREERRRARFAAGTFGGRS